MRHSIEHRVRRGAQVHLPHSARFQSLGPAPRTAGGRRKTPGPLGLASSTLAPMSFGNPETERLER